MDRQLRLRRQMPYVISTGLIMVLTRQKGVNGKPKSRMWWKDILKEIFSGSKIFECTKNLLRFCATSWNQNLKLPTKRRRINLNIEQKVVIEVY